MKHSLLRCCGTGCYTPVAPVRVTRHPCSGRITLRTRRVASHTQQQPRASPLLPARRTGLPSRTSWSVPQPNRKRVVARADPLLPVGMDLLTFLAATVVVVPLAKRVNVSPVIAFLFSGFVLQQLGVFQDLHGIEKLSELGVLFLLFEMGLELSLDRLKALAKFAFGLGSLQVLLCTAFFTLFALPVGSGLGTLFLEKVFNAPASLVSIRSVDEALVIGAALSMSSSAFVLQLLSERGEMASRVGSATLGVLLFQDIAVVPLLVLLPLIESSKAMGDMDMSGTSMMSLVQMLGPTALTTTAGLGLLLLGGKYVLRYVFEMVAASRSSETFVALCLLTVTGISLCTQQLGLSDTMGAFLAGVLLSETSFRTQVEADIRPFKGLLLGLFFVTTGSSINSQVLLSQLPVVMSILVGLLVVKTTVIAALGPRFGLTRNESIRMGFLLSQGGEFAFVLLSLAQSLNLLVEDLNQVLIIVVVLSMALTPTLAELGKRTGDFLDVQLGREGGRGGGEGVGAGKEATASLAAGGSGGGGGQASMHGYNVEEPVLICGFTTQAQILANMLESPLASSEGLATPYLAMDVDPGRVEAGHAAGFRVLYGDVTRPNVLASAGVRQPRAVVVTYSASGYCVRAVHALRAKFPAVPILASARDFRHAAELKEAGADSVVMATTQSGLALGTQLLTTLGQTDGNIAFLRQSIEDAVATRMRDMMQQDKDKKEASNAGASRWKSRAILVLDSARQEAAEARPGLGTPQAALPETVGKARYNPSLADLGSPAGTRRYSSFTDMTAEAREGQEGQEGQASDESTAVGATAAASAAAGVAATAGAAAAAGAAGAAAAAAASGAVGAAATAAAAVVNGANGKKGANGAAKEGASSAGSGREPLSEGGLTAQPAPEGAAAVAADSAAGPAGGGGAGASEREYAMAVKSMTDE